ncbi:ECF-type sigma factor negative effector [Bacillus thuringiensis serovar huazhongensis BGSC 4BD1]|nr:ECF-type sigma factor negative effector [Bacillus thuringiensis serovar huazhongensis BGSC 4BD1]
MNRGGSKVKRRLIAGVLAAALLIPTTGFAYQSIMADGIYGSFENLKKHAGAMTLEAYMRFSAKLLEAKDEMGAKEYEEFTKELKKLTDAKLAYGDSNGNIDYDQLSSAKKEEMKRIEMELQPYFDKLNGHKSSKEVLTPEEYEQYMEALMSYQTVLVKTKSSGGITVEEVPEAYKERFIKAEQFMEYVNEKVR